MEGNSILKGLSSSGLPEGVETVLALLARFAVALLHGSTGLYKLILGLPATADLFLEIFVGSWLPAEIIVAYAYVMPFIQVGIALWLISGYRMQLAWIFTILFTWTLGIGSLIAGGPQMIAAVNATGYIMVCMVGLVLMPADTFRWGKEAEASLQQKLYWAVLFFRGIFACALVLQAINRIYEASGLGPDQRPMGIGGILVVFTEIVLAIWLISGRRSSLAWICTCVFFLGTAASFELMGRFGIAVNHFRFGFISLVAFLLTRYVLENVPLSDQSWVLRRET